MREKSMEGKRSERREAGLMPVSGLGRWVADPSRPYVAVASREGRFVDEHLGLAPYLLIYGKKNHRVGLVGVRKMPDPTREERSWEKLAVMLKDCRAVLANGAGEPPTEVLSQKGIKVIDESGRVDEVLEKVFSITS